MQPLTPAERREIERVKNELLSCQTASVDLYDENDNPILDNIGNRELWLKVLTMALETNEALSEAWARRDTKYNEFKTTDFDEAKRRLGR